MKKRIAAEHCHDSVSSPRGHAGYLICRTRGHAASLGSVKWLSVESNMNRNAYIRQTNDKEVSKVETT